MNIERFYNYECYPKLQILKIYFENRNLDIEVYTIDSFRISIQYTFLVGRRPMITETTNISLQEVNLIKEILNVKSVEFTILKDRNDGNRIGLIFS